MLGDDNYNTGYFFDHELVEQLSPQTLTMKIEPWDELVFPGDRLRFADKKGNQGLGEAIVVTVDSGTKDRITVSLDRAMRQLPPSTIASNNHGTQRYVYRKNRLPPVADASLPGLRSAIFRCLVMIITTQATSLTTS